MRFRMAAAAVAAAAIAGCTHTQLTKSTVGAVGTVTEIHYRSVLMNLAMFAGNPDALPNHIRLADGVVQINDELGFGNAGGFTTRGTMDFGIDRYGPFGSRQIVEQWGSDAIGDPVDLKSLQDLYRAALGLPPLPDPNAIAYLKRTQGEASGAGGGGSATSPASASVDPTSTAGGPAGSEKTTVPIGILLRDVPPPGWFGLGGKRDVPKDACYVGRWCDRYAWVTRDGLPELSRFTLAVLNVVKFEATGRGGDTSSLAVTGN